MYALLIAEDPDEVAILSMVLQRAGFAVTSSPGLDQALQNWNERPADLVMLVVSSQAPQEQVRLVRAETLAPLAIVLRMADEYLHYELLKLGADLVIAPPYSARLLIAQVGVLIRRTSSVPAFSLPNLSAAGLTLNPATRTVEFEQRPMQRLTQLEFRLLYTLIMNRGHVIPTETIVERVWGYTGQGDRDLVRGLVSRLRTKIEADPHNPKYIQTVPGLGYSFVDGE